MLLRRRVPECARPVSLLKNSTRLRSVDDHVSKKRLKTTTTTTTFHTLCWADVAFRSEWLILIKNFSNFPCTHTRQIDVTQATHKHTNFSTGLLLFFFRFFHTPNFSCQTLLKQICCFLVHDLGNSLHFFLSLTGFNLRHKLLLLPILALED